MWETNKTKRGNQYEIQAGEATETENTFVYEYVDYVDSSGFRSNFYRLSKRRITIQKENGAFVAETLMEREPENMPDCAFDR